MRSDFLGDCAQFRDLPEAINESQYLIPRMTRDQRRDAIKGPVGVAGGTISPSLVQELLNDMGDDPDQLPILQHALMRTWEESTPEGHLELDDYKEVGGMADALSIHADEALEDLTKGRSPEKSVRLHLLAQRLFRAITERGPDNREVRRPMLLKDICEIADCSEEEMIEVIEIFRAKQRSFLMPPAPTPLTGDSRIDISHESLIRQWVSLKQWVANEAHDVETYLRLAQDAQRHAAGTYDLLGKTSEEFNRTWWDEAQITSGWAAYHFDSLSREEVLAYLDRSRQQWIDEEEARIQAERDRLRRTRQFATVLGLLLLVAIGIGVFAVIQWDKATNLAKDFETKSEEATQLASDFQSKSEEATQLASDFQSKSEEANRLAEDFKSQSQESNRLAEEANRLAKDFESRTYDANYNLATVFEEKARTAVENQSIKEEWLYTLEALRKEIGPNYQQPVSLGILMNPEKRQEIFRSSWTSPTGLTSEVRSVAFSPDGQTIASASARQHRSALGAQLGPGDCPAHGTYILAVYSVAFSPDGQTIAFASRDNTVRLWERSSGQEIAQLTGHTSSVWSVAFSPDGQTIASASADNTVRLWERSSGQEIAQLTGHTSSVYSVAFSPDGQTIASASADNTVRLWERSSGQEIAQLTGHTSDVWSVAFSPDGQTIASASNDNTVRLWERSSGQEIAQLTGHTSSVLSVAFSPDGQTIASASDDNTVRLWERSSGQEITQLTGHTSEVYSVAFSPDGQTIASASIRQHRSALGAQLWPGDRTAHGTYIRRLERGLQPRWADHRIRFQRQHRSALGAQLWPGDRTAHWTYILRLERGLQPRWADHRIRFRRQHRSALGAQLWPGDHTAHGTYIRGLQRGLQPRWADHRIRFHTTTPFGSGSAARARRSHSSRDIHPPSGAWPSAPMGRPSHPLP